MPADGFVDLGKTRHQIVQFLLQPGKVTVYRIQLFAELRFEPENRIFARPVVLEASPDDRSLSSQQGNAVSMSSCSTSFMPGFSPYHVFAAGD